MTDRRVRQALARIAAAWPLLDDHRDAASAHRRPEPRQMGGRAKASLDALLRLEREERAGRQARLSAPGAAPANLDIVDVEHLAVTTLRDLCWLSTSVLRGPWLPGTGWWTMPHPWTPHRGLWALHHAAPWWPADFAADAGRDLTQVAAELERTVGLDRHDDEIRHGAVWWVSTAGAARRLGVSPDNVRDWYRRGLIVDEHGVDHSRALGGTGGSRWYRLADVRLAARRVGRDAPDEAA